MVLFMEKKNYFWFCIYNIYQIFFFFFCVFNGVFNLYGNGYLFIYFSYITIIVDLYGTAHGKNNQLYNYFCFWFLCLLAGVFILYSTDFYFLFYFIFSYITIVVNLYDTNHEKNNQLYNFFGFWFLCLQHIPILFLLLKLFCSGIFQFIHNKISSKTHKKCKYIMHFKMGILGIWLKYNIIPPPYYIVSNYGIQIQGFIHILSPNWWIVIIIPLQLILFLVILIPIIV